MRDHQRHEHLVGADPAMHAELAIALFAFDPVNQRPVLAHQQHEVADARMVPDVVAAPDHEVRADLHERLDDVGLEDEAVVTQLQLARDAGALAWLPIDLAASAILLAWWGDFAKSAEVIAEADAVTEATQTRIAPYGAMLRATKIQICDTVPPQYSFHC